MTTLDVYLTVNEVAEALRVSAETVRRMARRGELPAMRLGPRMWRFPERAVVDWQERQQAIAAGAVRPIVLGGRAR